MMDDNQFANSEYNKTEHNLPVLSVAEISNALKRTVEENFDRVRIRGEISGFKRAASGHLYFTLKDESAVIDSVCWKGSALKLGIKPEDGMDVVALGRLTTYPGRSKYQIVVEAIELAGVGALLKLLEDRRKRLTEEGLFDTDRKRPIPYLPDVIGVVTSPTGAVIRDILHRLEDRFPRHVLVWPTPVQGEGAAEKIATAIDGFNRVDGNNGVPRPDVLIIARGGGSLEDLWAFNEECVVRAVSESTIPVISAIGHETDTTLIDYAADRRAPTPTAAAEMTVPVHADLQAGVMSMASRLLQSIARLKTEKSMALDGLSRGLSGPERMLDTARQRLDEWSERLSGGLQTGLSRQVADLERIVAGLRSPDDQILLAENRLQNETRSLTALSSVIVKEKSHRLENLGSLLTSYSFERVLDRGFALMTDPDGKPVTTVKGLKTGDMLSMRLADGKKQVMVSGGGKLKKKVKKTPPSNQQGQLL